MTLSIARTRLEPIDVGRPGLRLTLATPAGREGQGDAVPLPGRSRDDLAACRAVLDLGPFEIDADLAAVEARVGAIAAAPAAAFALETALLDLLAQARGVPVWSLLNGGAPPAPVEVNALLRGPDLVAEARASSARTFKVKIGRRPFELELEALRALRAHLGPEPALRLDANQRFTAEQAPARLQALAELAPEYVEEPVADLAALGRAPVPLAADETLERPGGVEVALAHPDVEVLVLKPMFLGGVLRCRHLAARGKDVVVTHADDGPLANAAAWHLARSLDPPPRACGLLV